MKKALVSVIVVLCFVFLPPSAKAMDDNTADLINKGVGLLFGTMIQNGIDRQQQQQPGNNSASPPAAGRTNFDSGHGVISINDFCSYTDCNVEEPVILEDESFKIVAFNNGDYSFGIVITNIDIEKTRNEAEQKFMELLGIGPVDACKLPVLLVVDEQVNSHAKMNGGYGLLFCRDSKRFSDTALKEARQRLSGGYKVKRR